MELIVDRSLRHWWVFVVRGILFILLGVYMFLSPASSYEALGFTFGLVILLAGVTELLRVTRQNDKADRSWHLMLGLIDIILGVILMGHIAASVEILRIIVGLYFLFRGIGLFTFSRLTGRSRMLTLGGILTVVAAIMIIFNAAFGAMTIILLIAIAFVVTGIFNIWLGFRLKRI